MAVSREEAFKILGLEEGATEQEIKDRYRKLALKWHPDKQEEKDSTIATEKFQKLSAAYKKLTTDEEITKDELINLFQQMFNCQVSVCRLDGGNIIFMNGPMPNGDIDYDSNSDSDSGTPVHSVSTEHGSNNTGDESAAAKAAAELLKEEEEKTQKAERRRAKNKKKKEAKRRKKHNNSTSNGTGPAPAAASHHNKESGSSSSQKQKSNPPVTATVTTAEEKLNNSTTEVEDNGDIDNDEMLSDMSDDEDAVMNSAFFAHAAQGAISKLGNEGKVLSSGGDKNGGHSMDECDPAMKRSRDIAKEGNILATNGEFKSAIEKFTEAIRLYPGDQRYYGNRSFCYDLLGDYDNALIDACEAVRLAPGWAKGYLRKGRALYGLKQYDEAEKAYQDVLKYDSNNEDATKELYKCHTLQLMAMGFSVDESEAAARKHTVMAHAIDDLLAGKVETIPAGGPRSAGFTPSKGSSSSSKRHASADSIFDSPKIKVEDGFAVRSLWVGNVNPERVTESHIAELFGKYGRVVSVRILVEKHCAFINFERPQAAADALNGLQGYYLGGGYLLIRYPDNPKASLIHSRAEKELEEPEEEEKNTNANYSDFAKKTGPVNGNECYFWRTTGCHFGRKCHYKHIPQHRGIDRTATMVPKPRS